MIRVAAVGDIHLGTDSRGRLRAQLGRPDDDADLFLLAGDLTTCGHPDEGAVVARRSSPALGVPAIAVLGNHDHHADRDGADLVLHGHAHAGTAAGETPGGIPVRNVAQPVIAAAGSRSSWRRPGLIRSSPRRDRQEVLERRRQPARHLR
ncbi:MAG: hypothetical protein QOK40_664 [Miltoncostaeaceae bacterium]|nr:hypothetical protein [Miltoncostaeaceae bacterium]